MADDIVAESKRGIDDIVSATPPDQDDPLIWISGTGTGRRIPKRGITMGRNQMTLSQMTQSVKAAAANRDPYFSTLADDLVKVNLLSESGKNVIDYVVNGLEDAVGLYQAYSATGGEKSFTDWWGDYTRTAPGVEKEEAGGGRGGYAGPVTTTTINITDEVTAEALIDGVARDLLGRSLTPKETQKYLRQFRTAEMESPQVTTTTPGVSTRSTETVTAADKGELLRQIISENPDYQDFQIDTTIMDMLLDDIKAGQEIIYG